MLAVNYQVATREIRFITPIPRASIKNTETRHLPTQNIYQEVQSSFCAPAKSRRLCNPAACLPPTFTTYIFIYLRTYIKRAGYLGPSFPIRNRANLAKAAFALYLHLHLILGGCGT